MNRQIRQLGIFLVMCYLALFVKLNQVQFFGAEELNDHPLNATKVTQAFNRPRGSIVTADGVLLAESVPAAEDSQFDRQRVYPQGDLYGQHLILEFVARLRPEMRFPSVDALREQIARDVEAARGLLQDGP